MERHILHTTALESLGLSDAALIVVFFLRLAGEAIDVDDARRPQLVALLLQTRSAFL